MATLVSDWLRQFRLLLWNCWMEFNETWQEGRSQRPLPILCFSCRSEKQDGRFGLWLADTFATSPVKPLNGIQRNSTGSNIWMSSTSFLSGRSEKQDCRPGLWLAETFSTSPLQRLNGIQRNLTGSKISMSSTKFVFFLPIGKTRWLPHLWLAETFSPSPLKPLNGIHSNLTGRKILISSTQVCVFRANRKNKMATLASDWLSDFWLFLWNHWTEFNETWQEARSQCLLPSFCFSGRSEKQDCRPGLWLAETFSTSPLKRLNGIHRNLTGSKISMSSTILFFFSGRSEKTRWLQRLWLAETFSPSPLKPLNGIH